MNQSIQSPERKPKQSSSLTMATLGAQIGCLTLIIVLGAVFGGIFLDRLLGTKPILTIILVLGSAPLALVVTYWMAMRAVKNINSPIPKGAQANAMKEDETGE